jgi:pimeloyl-ACP methyl ester carboxylesterase
MPELRHDSLRLHYVVHGAGPAVLLLHGGVSSFEHNFAQFGWVEALVGAGRQVVGFDFRGHGRSDRPHEVGRYGTPALVGDALAVLDHLQLARVALVGYSIGSAVALELMRRSPPRFERAVLVAAGDGLVGHPPLSFPLVLPDLARVFDREAYPADLPRHHSAYWKVLESVGGDRLAMRALVGAGYPPLRLDEAAAIDVPTLVISGERDQVLGRGSRLAAALGRADYLEIAGANHFALAMDPAVRAAVARFLDVGPARARPEVP